MNNNKHSAQLIGAMLIGVAVGAIGGVLFAPEKGKKTRKKIVKGAQEATNNFKNSIQEQINTLRSEAEELASSAKSKSEEIAKDVRQKADSVRNAV